MKNTTAVINSALAAVVALGSLGLPTDSLAQEKQGEKCYGVAKEDPTAFMYVPKGTCEKIAGASLTPKE